MSEEINFDDVEFGEPIEKKEPTYRDGYIRGIYRARNIIDSKQKEIERLKSRLEEYQEYVEINHKEIERLNNIRNKAIEYVEESYNVTVEGIEGVAEFFSKRNEILSKILKGEDKE